MKKSLVVFMTTGLVLTAASTAYARTEANVSQPTPDKGNIVAETSTPAGIDTNSDGVYDSKDFRYYELGSAIGSAQSNNGDSTHVYGTWNSPFTSGIDGYNYNDAQDYVAAGDQDTTTAGGPTFKAGPHGGYLTSTHRCRECHAVHRAAGKFKLLRSDTRFEACDWCHGTGAGSGFNIQMDNNDDYTAEYNVGHTMGYGIDSGKWRAPDDTYPAYAPNYYMGGFSCFDCHSPHANPQRMLGYSDAGIAVGVTVTTTTAGYAGKKYGIANPGHGNVTDGATDHVAGDPVYLSGSWLLIKDPDREIADENTSVPGGIYATATATDPETTSVSILAGQEIPDYISAPITKWADGNYYPVNKLPTDWDSPVGPAGSPNGPYAPDDSTTVAGPRSGYTVRFMTKRIWNVSEFCSDCHDGNAGLHTVGAPLFSEDRALRGQGNNTNTTDLTDTAYKWKGNYDVAYGHDAQPRH